MYGLVTSSIALHKIQELRGLSRALQHYRQSESEWKLALSDIPYRTKEEELRRMWRKN